MNTCTFPSSGYTNSKPNGPVPEKHHEISGSKLHRQVSFCHVQILTVRAFAHRLMVTDGVGKRVTCAARLISCFSHSRPPYAMKTQKVVSQTRSGAKTMTAITEAHTTAPMSPQATTAQEAIAAHMGVHNCLTMAAWHIAKGTPPAAARKVRQALAALRQLDKLEA